MSGSSVERLSNGSLSPLRDVTNHFRESPDDFESLDALQCAIRARNEYVENPTRTSSKLTTVKTQQPTIHSDSLRPVSTVSSTQPSRTPTPQPKINDKRPETATCSEKIICPKCGRCKCRKCTTKLELPRMWCGRCECSCQQAVDCISCLCCVECAFYHGCNDDDDKDCADDPCACTSQPKCCQRWTCLVFASLCLPCLLLYWPLRLSLGACTRCYNHCGKHRGCRCNTRLSHTGFLLEAESSTT